MHRRIQERLAQAGLAAQERSQILDTHAAVLLHRFDVLEKEDHFELLHPSRTLLILLDDCGVVDADVLSAAASIESEHVALRVAPANEIARAVPLPDAGDELLERLVVAGPEIRLIALAERLDHARHLHLRAAAAWPAFHDAMCAIYAPVARRTHPRLEERFDHWCDMFGRRFLGAAGSI
ncbi:MAG TPA: hypothetical protein VMN78_09540 [Longimicrobiales bacterium]|nr:hypothetical protein [Longimicrobiales bacterium]